MNNELLNELDKLSRLAPLLDFDNLWPVISPSLSSICRISLAMTFFFILLNFLTNLVHHDKPISFYSVSNVLVKGILIAIFFGISPIYQGWTGLFIKLFGSINQAFASDSFINFQANFRAYLYGVQNTVSDSVSPSFKYLNPLNWIVSYINQFIIVSYYFLISVGPCFMLFSIFLGPLCGSLSLFFPSIGRNWATFFASSIFFSAIVGIGLVVIGDSGLLKIVSGFSFVNSQIVAIIILFTVLFFFSMVPIVVSMIFGVQFYSFISKIFGITYGAMGLLPIAFTTVASSKIVKKAINKALKNVKK